MSADLPKQEVNVGSLTGRSVTRRDFLRGASTILIARKIPKVVHSQELFADVVIIGAGVGGCAAALAALRMGLRVVLTNDTEWIGGQLTAQAVPPDEHPWIEQFGCTASYRRYREAVRQFYRDHYPLTREARSCAHLNPGNGTVSALTHEFKVSVAVLNEMLAPYKATGHLQLLLPYVPVQASVEGDTVRAVTVEDVQSASRTVLQGNFFLDATELGDLLPLSGAEHVTGTEAQSETGELHAAPTANARNSQSFTMCFAIDHIPRENHIIDKPRDYEFWRNYIPPLHPAWTGRLFDWIAPSPQTLKPVPRYLGVDRPAEGDVNLWVFRRIADRKNFIPGALASDISLVNWPQVDFWEGDLVTASPQARKNLIARAKQQSLSFLYWMQTEAPNLHGGEGFPGLRLRKDVVGTEDGLAQAPYIRESRRLRTIFTVKEQHVGTEMRLKNATIPSQNVRAEYFADSVGIGAYRIDLHPTCGKTNYIDVSSLPFQIPLGALVPVRLKNLLPACKNIGTTHITNGCYRLHHVEWNIGESAGALAAFCIRQKLLAKEVYEKSAQLADFQKLLSRSGVELEWPLAKVHAL